MKVVHLSSSPLVGAPFFWSECFNKSGLIESRCYSARWQYADGKVYPHDVETAEEAKQLCKEAGRVILHNRRASGFDIPREKIRFVIHSTPTMVDSQLLEHAPKAGVICQMQPRYYRKKRRDIHLLPNLIDLDRFPTYPERTGRLNIGFSPSNLRTYPKTDSILYMNTKEVEPTKEILNRVQGAGVGFWHGLPWESLMRERAYCDLIIDEVATGGYHRTSLEAAASSQVPINAADALTLGFLSEVTGVKTHPFRLTDLSHLQDLLVGLVGDPDATREAGMMARAWMEAHFDPTALIANHFFPFLE